MLRYPLDTIIFFVDLVILNAMSILNICFKSIFTRQEIDEIFGVNVKIFIDFLTSKYRMEAYIQNTVAPPPPRSFVFRPLRSFGTLKISVVKDSAQIEENRFFAYKKVQ